MAAASLRAAFTRRRVRVHRFQGATLLPGGTIANEIPARNLVQLRRELHSNDLFERIIGGHQQTFALAGSEVDKHEIFMAADGNVSERLMEATLGGGLIAMGERGGSGFDAQLV